MTLLYFVLCVFGISYFLLNTKLPFFYNWRSYLKSGPYENLTLNWFLGEVLSCIFCFSFWVGFVLSCFIPVKFFLLDAFVGAASTLFLSELLEWLRSKKSVE